MAKNNKREPFFEIVYSTDPDRRAHQKEEEAALPPEKQVLRIWLERGKGGKEATVIKGFIGPTEALSELAKWLKGKCAAGGSAKDGEIILQGNHRDRVMTLLQERGYKNVKKAGG